MGNKSSKTPTPSAPKRKPLIKGYARHKGDHNPANTAFWIDDSLLTHEKWKNTEDLSSRKKKGKAATGAGKGGGVVEYDKAWAEGWAAAKMDNGSGGGGGGSGGLSGGVPPFDPSMAGEGGGKDYNTGMPGGTTGGLGGKVI